jgi:imidazolonepropionase-like amidohydrolase
MLSIGLLVSSFTTFASGVAGQEHFDTLIRDGFIFDGTGNPWYRADVGIRGSRFVAMGRRVESEADVVIDATGLYVAPGFIDVHFHAAEGLLRAELKDSCSNPRTRRDDGGRQRGRRRFLEAFETAVDRSGSTSLGRGSCRSFLERQAGDPRRRSHWGVLGRRVATG